ncbi:MAG: glycosyltransferase [Bacteroidia bacterium]|jgi:glycosyltransferase involved in cell wall biosynthesis|nr:glycosyltransferase [Bacteroidia bacterium]
MRLLLLADADSAHTRKWATALAAQGIAVGIFSLRKSTAGWAGAHKGITIFDAHGLGDETFTGSAAGKWVYLKMLFPLRRVLGQFRPHIVHAHYATSYGLLGRLCGFHPFVLSAWGSDVMNFPQRNFLNRFLLRGNLRAADVVLATSPTISRYIKEVVPRDVEITPFGIDTVAFCRQPVTRIFGDDCIVIGAVKALEKVYRHDSLLNAFAALHKANPGLPLRLLLVGDGTQRDALEQQAHTLGIAHLTKFAGRVQFADVPQWHNQLDIFVNISEYESFGVSVLEAMACEVPVIVTDTGGLAELVEQGREGYRVPLQGHNELVERLRQLATNAGLRRQLGNQGRQTVLRSYTWQNNLQQMLAIYKRLAPQAAL